MSQNVPLTQTLKLCHHHPWPLWKAAFSAMKSRLQIILKLHIGAHSILAGSSTGITLKTRNAPKHQAFKDHAACEMTRHALHHQNSSSSPQIPPAVVSIPGLIATTSISNLKLPLKTYLGGLSLRPLYFQTSTVTVPAQKQRRSQDAKTQNRNKRNAACHHKKNEVRPLTTSTKLRQLPFSLA